MLVGVPAAAHTLADTFGMPAKDADWQLIVEVKGGDLAFSNMFGNPIDPALGAMDCPWCK